MAGCDMTSSRDIPDIRGIAVVVFESSMLQRVLVAVRTLGLEAEGFDDASEAMAYIAHPQTTISIVVAGAHLPGVLNGPDLTTTLSRAYPTLPFVIADHYEGLVESNVMCLDNPWTLDDIEEKAASMLVKLPVGKQPTLESTV
jgi:hypothetical protein